MSAIIHKKSARTPLMLMETCLLEEGHVSLSVGTQNQAPELMAAKSLTGCFFRRRRKP